MDIWIDGALHLNDFDIVAASGFETAYVYQTPSLIVVTDGDITIQFKSVKRNAMISGIEVLLAPSAIPLETPTTIPTKSPTFLPTEAPKKTSYFFPIHDSSKISTNETSDFSNKVSGKTLAD